MNTLRRIFHQKTSSVTSPMDDEKALPRSPTTTSKFSFRRSNSASILNAENGENDEKKTSSKKSRRRTVSWVRKSPSDLQQSTSAGALPSTQEGSQVKFQSLPTKTGLKDSFGGGGSASTTSSRSRIPPIDTNVGSSNNNRQILDTPITIRQNEADEYIQQGIQFHESNQLEKATYHFKKAAEKGSPLGMFLYGIALRHGWGCKTDPRQAVKYLQKAAESAVADLHASVVANPSIARHELVLAIYELGVCFRHGWGVPKNKVTAAYYFEIAANLGDPDAQNELGFCYANGQGVKKDMKKAAKYYRMAAAQGAAIWGNSWIHKKKYDEVARDT